MLEQGMPRIERHRLYRSPELLGLGRREVALLDDDGSHLDRRG